MEAQDGLVAVVLWGARGLEQHIIVVTMFDNNMESLFTCAEACQYLGVSRSTVNLYITKNHLPAFRKGRAWLIFESDLKAFKESEWFQVSRHERPGAPQKTSRRHASTATVYKPEVAYPKAGNN